MLTKSLMWSGLIECCTTNTHNRGNGCYKNNCVSRCFLKVHSWTQITKSTIKHDTNEHMLRRNGEVDTLSCFLSLCQIVVIVSRFWVLFWHHISLSMYLLNRQTSLFSLSLNYIVKTQCLVVSVLKERANNTLFY